MNETIRKAETLSTYIVRIARLRRSSIDREEKDGQQLPRMNSTVFLVIGNSQVKSTVSSFFTRTVRAIAHAPALNTSEVS